MKLGLDFKRTFSRVGLGGFLGALITLFLGVTLYETALGSFLHRLSYDFLFLLRPAIVVDEAVVVYLDDESHEQLQQPYTQPWDRRLHAKLIDRLREAGAATIVYDIIFSDPSTEEADQALAAAIKRHGKVILAADWVKLEHVPGATKNEHRVAPPLDLFFEDEDDIAIAEMGPDPDQVVRTHYPMDIDSGIAALGWAAAKIQGVPVAQDPENAKETRWYNYYGPSGQIPSVSLYKVLSDGPDRTPPEVFRGKVVFVGARILTYMSGQRKDEYRSPYSYFQGISTTSRFFFPGVEIHATAFLNLARGDWLRRFPAQTEIAIVTLTGLLFGYLLAQLRPVLAATCGGALIALVLIAVWTSFTKYFLWFPWIIVAGIQIPFATVYSIVFNSISLYVQKRLMENSIAMYVSPQLAKQILKDPEMLKPGAKKQTLSVLFSDIANFTTMSEGMDPDDLAILMNRYFEGAVNDCVQKADGTVVKFIGDAIFAVWNAPLPQENHRELACRGAIFLRDNVSNFDFNRPSLEGLDIRTRIGLHCGEASVGNFGSTRRVDYTAFGENINLSSRMEGLNKYMGTSILATGDILNPIKEKFVSRFLGRFVLKGFNKEVDVHELIDLPENAAQSQDYREPFAAALDLFWKRDWDGAERIFNQILEKHPKDGPSKFYLKTLPDFRSEPPGPDWRGQIELKEK